mmetsp:Transcript_111591/g.320579  ORF Transcript_111591/g.320579 Transcript_111591/m.320579 type:complete len:109 (+) Transcript_111591:272-598(+)
MHAEMKDSKAKERTILFNRPRLRGLTEAPGSSEKVLPCRIESSNFGIGIDARLPTRMPSKAEMVRSAKVFFAAFGEVAGEVAGDLAQVGEFGVRCVSFVGNLTEALSL